jgi:hypothetical protein
MIALLAAFLVGCSNSNGTPDGNSGGSNPMETPNVTPEPTPQPTPEPTPEITPEPTPTPEPEPTLLEQAEIIEAKILPLYEILLDEIAVTFQMWHYVNVFDLWFKHLVLPTHPGWENAQQNTMGNEEVEEVIIEIKNTTLEELRVLYEELIELREIANPMVGGQIAGILFESLHRHGDYDDRGIHIGVNTLVIHYVGWY